jgi:hypothetical protein
VGAPPTVRLQLSQIPRQEKDDRDDGQTCLAPLRPQVQNAEISQVFISQEDESILRIMIYSILPHLVISSHISSWFFTGP